MTTRIEDTLAAATTAFRFAQQHWPTASRTSPLLLAMLTGAGVAVGIGAGLLFAPQLGSELRASLIEKARGYARAIGSGAAGVVNDVEEDVAAQSDAVARRNGATASRRSAAKHPARA